MSATGRGTKRDEYDSYPTPAWCTEAIVKEFVFPPCPEILEPCIGNGAIAKVIVEQIPDYSLDWCEITKGRDFLAHDFETSRYDFVITNPPFSLAQEFIEKSLTLSNCVVMLLRLNFLGSQSRKEFWQKHPPTAIHILTKRPSFTGKGTDATDYAWFVWDSTGRQKRGIYWI